MKESDNEEKEEDLLLAGFDDILVKPFQVRLDDIVLKRLKQI